jgi:hypothetical protein
VVPSCVSTSYLDCHTPYLALLALLVLKMICSASLPILRKVEPEATGLVENCGGRINYGSLLRALLSCCGLAPTLARTQRFFCAKPPHLPKLPRLTTTEPTRLFVSNSAKMVCIEFYYLTGLQ